MEYLKTSKIIKNGTSLAVVIPKPMLQALHLDRGDQVMFAIIGEGILAIKKVTAEDLQKWKT
jgi:antitoxin component of MazEF toxin-antitoxin module